ncbi:MAG TPA: hypothetical protein VFZ02_03160 [Ktedonobacteraceae bacterium]
MNNKLNYIDNFKRYRNKSILFSSTVVFIAIVVGLIFQTQEAQFISTVKAASQTMLAGDLSVVGKPSLPAATVDAIFKDLGSPMNGMGQVVVQASQKTNIDDAFALAVWWTETNDGAAGVGLADRNPGSVRGSVGYPSAYDGYTIYPSYSAAIVYWFNMLKNMYVNQGLSTVYLISHPYVGTSSSPLWAGKVVTLMLKYRSEAPPAPIVVPHGKRVTEPKVYIHTTPTSLEQQAQSQAGKTLKKRSSYIVRQVNTAPVVSPSIEYTIVFFALLLALTIVAGALWLEKRPIHNMEPAEAQGEVVQDENAQGEMMQEEGKQGENAQGEVVQGGGKPRTYHMRNARPFRSIALYAPIQNEDAPNTDALITTAQEMDAPNTDALVMRAQEMDTGANFRVRRTILLPSFPGTETAKTGESPAESSLSGRSTGLLSRYGETNQE